MNIATLPRRLWRFVRDGYLHTGERVCPDFQNDNFENHQKVYEFSLQFCKNKMVLDAGCGTGYGTALIGTTATIAIGIDISRQAIRYAKRKYRPRSALYLQMNAETLAFPPQAFDFIISTENLEHLEDQDASVSEMARCLKQDGMALIATPNREQFVGIRNPYHTKELTYEELLALVERHFGRVEILWNSLSGRASNTRFDFDRTHLSNTHSLFCFAFNPRR